MTLEEKLIQRYFDAFNRHDLEGVIACFDDDADDGAGFTRRIRTDDLLITKSPKIPRPIELRKN